MQKKGEMNILFLGTSFISIYEPIAHYFKSHKFDIEFLFCYYDATKIDNKYLTIYRHVSLPNKDGFNDECNISVLLSFLSSSKIDVVVNPNIPIDDIFVLVRKIKQVYPAIKCIDMLHSCVNYVVLNKQIELKEMKFRDVKSLKQLFQYLFPTFYLFLLQKIVVRRMKISYSIFDRIVLLSPRYVEDFINMLHLKEHTNKIVAIPNPKGFYDSCIPIRKKSKQIIFVGRLSKEKAVYRLLYIWKKVMSILPDWEMVIVGDGPERISLESLAVDLDLHRIQFCGFQKSISYIDKASILCLVSNFEGFPLVFLEAMSLGVVPVGFDSFSAIHDMINNGVNGIIVPSFDLDKYSASLINLAQNDQLRFRMAKEAQIKVKQYEVTNVAPLWYNLFKELM